MSPDRVRRKRIGKKIKKKKKRKKEWRTSGINLEEIKNCEYSKG